MPIAALTEDERKIVRRCIVALANGSFLSDGDFPLIVGVSREEAKQVADDWDQVNETSEVSTLTINNSLNGLLLWCFWQKEHPEAADQVLLQWTRATAADIERIFEKWRVGHPAT